MDLPFCRQWPPFQSWIAMLDQGRRTSYLSSDSNDQLSTNETNARLVLWIYWFLRISVPELVCPKVLTLLTIQVYCVVLAESWSGNYNYCYDLQLFYVWSQLFQDGQNRQAKTTRTTISNTLHKTRSYLQLHSMCNDFIELSWECRTPGISLQLRAGSGIVCLEETIHTKIPRQYTMAVKVWSSSGDGNQITHFQQAQLPPAGQLLPQSRTVNGRSMRS